MNILDDIITLAGIKKKKLVEHGEESYSQEAAYWSGMKPGLWATLEDLANRGYGPVDIARHAHDEFGNELGNDDINELLTVFFAEYGIDTVAESEEVNEGPFKGIGKHQMKRKLNKKINKDEADAKFHYDVANNNGGWPLRDPDVAYEKSKEAGKSADRHRKAHKRLTREEVDEAFKNDYSIGDRVTTPLGDGVIVAVSKNINVDGKVKVKLDHSDNPDGDTFVLTTTMLKHIQMEEVEELAEFTISDVQIAMKKKYGKVDKVAIEKLRKVMHLGNVDRNALVKVGHGKLHVGEAYSYLRTPVVQKIKEAYPAQQASRYNPDGKTYRGAANKMPTLSPDPTIDNAVPIDSILDMPDDGRIGDILDKVDYEKLQSFISDILSTLTPRQERVIRGRFFHNMTLDEIGKEFRVTRDRIHQIERKALQRLKHPAHAHKFRPYLGSE